MKPWLLLAILSASLLPTAPAHAAEPTPVAVTETRVLDPKGDVHVSTPAATQPDDGRFAHVDIRSAWIGNETPDNLEFGIQFERFQDPSGAPATPATSRTFVLRFSVGLAVISVGDGVPGCAGSGAGLRWERPNQGMALYCGIPMEKDAAAGSIRLVVRRQILINETGHPFGPGLEIQNFTAHSSAGFSAVEQAAIRAYDRAPDTGVAPAYRSSLGNVTGEGGLELMSRDPIRVSNGESTTLVYPLELINHRNVESSILLTATHTESAWQVRVPSRLTLPANGVVTFPVILSMGFTHRHGEMAMFQVLAEDANVERRWSQIHLGVYWLDTPQPAGHHNTLWLHSSPTAGVSLHTSVPPVYCQVKGGWMNPTEDEGRGPGFDQELAGCAFGDEAAGPGGYPMRQAHDWNFPLSPDLRIGLDLDLDRTGTFTTEVRPRVSSPRATLQAGLYYCDPDARSSARGPESLFCSGGILIAEGASPPLSASANAPIRFEMELKPLPAGDLLPYKRDSDLVFHVRLLTDTPQGPPSVAAEEFSPLLNPKKSLLQLPLVEYHDPIDQAFQNVGSLRLTPLAPFEKPVNPGRIAFFPFDLSNLATAEQEVELAVEGPGADWATFTTGEKERLAPSENKTIRLRVQAPDGAAPGERAELFLVAQSRTDPNVVAISRLRATVVDPAARDIPNEVVLDADAAGSVSSLGLVSVVLVAGFVVLTRRRL